MFSSSIRTQGDNQDAPDYVYYNADIINNTTVNTFGGVAIKDPQIRFNETRDTAIIKNAADYYFSIIRFTMDGANKDLPLFIPNIAEGTGQTNPNLTTYSMAVSFSQDIELATGPVIVDGIPSQRYIQYSPETLNPTSAPPPRSINNPDFLGFWNASNQYRLNDIVSTALPNQYGSFDGSFYQVVPQPAWQSNQAYAVGTIVQYNNIVYVATSPSQNVVPPFAGTWALGPPTGPAWNNLAVYPAGSIVLSNNIAWIAVNPVVGTAPAFPAWSSLGNINPPTSNFWGVVGNDLGNTQDLTSRYYWVYTYQHWVDLWNATMVDVGNFAATPNASNANSTCAYQDTYNAFYADYLLKGGVAGEFPYATFGDFCNAVYPPVMKFVADTSKFDIYLDSAGFGQRLTAFTPTPFGPSAGFASHPVCRLFFNANMYGLFSNYDNFYWNFSPLNFFGGLKSVPDGYVNEILPVNKAFQNIADFRLTPYTGVAPLGYTPVDTTGTAITPNMINRVFYIAQQDYSSTDSLWSPISSLVFTSTLLPVKAEATGAPVVLGAGNLGFSSATVQSAFQPIITDIALDTSVGNSDAYRRFIYYAPSAEYRLSDFASSKQEIRNIDIQVFWKNRLDNQLYPINMFNLSSVAIKVMFKHKDAGLGKP